MSLVFGITKVLLGNSIVPNRHTIIFLIRLGIIAQPNSDVNNECVV